MADRASRILIHKIQDLQPEENTLFIIIVSQLVPKPSTIAPFYIHADFNLPIKRHTVFKSVETVNSTETLTHTLITITYGCKILHMS